MGGRERNACIKDKEGLALTTRLCFGYASPVDTAMVRRGPEKPESIGAKAANAAFFVSKEHLRKIAHMLVSFMGEACGTASAGLFPIERFSHPASPRPPA
mgnify:FL=1|jgi:hypothetical protein